MNKIAQCLQLSLKLGRNLWNEYTEEKGTWSRNEAEDLYDCTKLQCNTGSILGQWFQWDFDEECHTPVFFQDAVLHNYLNLYLPFHTLPYQPLPTKIPENKMLDTIMICVKMLSPSHWCCNHLQSLLEVDFLLGTLSTTGGKMEN